MKIKGCGVCGILDLGACAKLKIGHESFMSFSTIPQLYYILAGVLEKNPTKLWETLDKLYCIKSYQVQLATS